MDNLSEVTVVMPFYNEDQDITYNLQEQLELMGAEVIVVDDGSKNPYPYGIRHEKNIGYGQSLMTGISMASRSVIITCDSDNQHRIQDIVNLATVWKMLDVDMIIGSRRLDYEEPLRMWGRKCLNFIASLFALVYLQDLNSGLRIFKRDIAKGYFPILCKTFSFTTSLTMSMLCDNYKVEFFPIKVKKRSFGKSHVNVIKDGWITLYYILRIGFALKTRGIRQVWRKLIGSEIS